MNERLLEIATTDFNDRKVIFQNTGRELKTRPEYIEKDFWVTVVLDVLFNDIAPNYKEGDLFLFKGGTSLSKCHNLINRFSEDIDIVISRKFLGFGDDKDPMILKNDFGSNKKHRKVIESLAEKCRDYVSTDLKLQLEQLLPMVSIAVDEVEPTLHIHYPSCYMQNGNDYVMPVVKLEGGAKSAVTPAALCNIEPYISSVVPDDFNLSISGVNSIIPERTLMDKLLILHGWNYGTKNDLNRIPKEANRLSRHYYDVAQLWSNQSLKDTILDMEDLLAQACSHNARSGFARKWMGNSELTFDTMVITPNDALKEMLRHDYHYMKDMVFGDTPDFDTVLTELWDMQSAIDKAFKESSSLKL